MSLDDHKRLIAAVLTVKGKVILSGYASDLYDKALRAWNRREVNVLCSSRVMTEGYDTSKKRPERTEVIWTNFDVEEPEVVSLWVEDAA